MLELIAINLKNDVHREYCVDKNKKYKAEWNNLIKISPRHNAVEYYRQHGKPIGVEIILVGEPETVEEKLVKAYYQGIPNYLRLRDEMPEDFVEGRKSFDDMIRYADEMKYFIEDLLKTI